MLAEWAQHGNRYGEDAVGVFFRRELTQLDEAIERSKQLYTPLGAVFTEQKKQWVFPNGARLKFRYLDRDSDAEAYQGHSYTRVYLEELTNFPSQGPVMKLKATLRSPKGVPCRFRATANPGGPGHQWVKSRYIDPAPQGYVPIIESERYTLPDGQVLDQTITRVYIPARLTDNPALLNNDPSYVARLKQSGSEALVRAWLEGDWNVIEGAYFDCWRTAEHVIRPFEVPDDWLRFRSMDWGSARPFDVSWWAVVQEPFEHDGRLLPKGAIVCYRQWYGVDRQPDGSPNPNVGLKLHAEEVAAGILEREPEKMAWAVCDPSMFKQDGGPSIVERMMRATKGKVGFRPADNQRLPGWDQVRGRLIGEDDRPMIYWFSTCADTIRTLPALQHDEKRPEDLDTDGEDHAADSVRYACMSRPYTPVRKVVEPMRGLREMTLNELWKLAPGKTGRI